MIGIIRGFGSPCVRGRRAVEAFLLSAVLIGAAWAQSALPIPKISPFIEWHRQEKQGITPQSPAAHVQMLKKLGIRTENVNSESCALYVNQPLSADEIAKLAVAGIVLEPNYIPPVPGHHPKGFYIARVPYSQVGAIAADDRFVRLSSIEMPMRALNDKAAELTHVDQVHNGAGVNPTTGAGVKIAVADTGFDIINNDEFPDFRILETFDMTSGVDQTSWGTDVRNTVEDHGTHVLGTLLASGVWSAGKYQGVAPDADFQLYKVESNSGIATEDMIEAIERAKATSVDIFSMSIGGGDIFSDGSDVLSQALDDATASGMTSFIAAGNNGTADQGPGHATFQLAPGATKTLTYTVPFFASDELIIDWRDNPADLGNISVRLIGSGATLTDLGVDLSDRGTEARVVFLDSNGPGQFQVQFRNNATDSIVPRVDIFTYDAAFSAFLPFDRSSSISTPALADTAIAVGAWVQRPTYTDWLGNFQDFGVSPYNLVFNLLAPFSSRGPRIDGLLKPEVCAPGAMTISVRDRGVDFTGAPLAGDDASIIPDDENAVLDGTEDAHYYVHAGTSMATPHAAGIGALLLSNNPNLDPAGIRAILTATASNASTPNNDVGYGLLDALGALQLDDSNNQNGLGRLLVTLTPDKARVLGGQWRRVGTTNWLNSGVEEIGLAPGFYTIEFKPVVGYVTPDNQDVEVIAADLTSVIGHYIAGALKVTIQPAAAVSAGAAWRRVGTTAWLPSGTTETPLAPGLYAVEFKPIPGTGFNAPPTLQDVNVLVDVVTQRTGTYSGGGSNVWSTYLGGTAFDSTGAVCSDGSGNFYMTGTTLSSNWASGGFGTVKDSGYDAFVAKFTGGGGLVWARYLGGNRDDSGSAITVDVSGNVYIAGTTASAGWASGGFDTSQGGGTDGFAAKLSPDGQLLWATYLGGAGNDSATGIAIDPSFNLFISGYTTSAGWTHGGFDTIQNGAADGFLVKLSNGGAHLWSTYLGGSSNDFANGVGVDSAGVAYVVGSTTSSGWVSGGGDTSYNGGSNSGDAFVIRILGSGSRSWSTYLGGNSDESGKGICVLPDGTSFVTGSTLSSGWVFGGSETVPNGNIDAFVTKLNSTGSIAWSTYLGGDKDDQGRAIAANAQGQIYVSGDTTSIKWANAGVAVFRGGKDAFVAKIEDSPGHPGSFAWVLPVGGSNDDSSNGVAIDGSGGIYAGGMTNSTGWTVNGYKTNYGGSTDAFGAKLLETPVGGAVHVVLDPAAAITAGAQWRIQGTQLWLDSGVTEGGLVPGNLTIEFKPAGSFPTPAPETTSIVSNQTAEVVGSYSESSVKSTVDSEIWTLFK